MAFVANVDFADDCDNAVFQSADFGRSDLLYMP